MTTPGKMFGQRTFGDADEPGRGHGQVERTRRPALSGRHHLSLVAAAATLLATAPLLSLYEHLTWLVYGTVAVAAVAGGAIAARALRAPDWAQLLAMAGALLLIVTWLFRSGDEFLLLPTPATFQHFGVLLGEVPDAIASEAIPVADLDGLLLLTTLGIGLVAIMVDLAAVGLRRPALAGLPMLAIYSVPVAVLNGSVPAYTFLIGALGFLWLVGTDNLDRVRRFGRRFSGDGRDVELWEPSPLASAGRRLAVLGAVIAVALPLAVPGMTTGLVDRFGSGFAGTGGEGGSPTSVNLFATLDGLLNREVTEELVRVTTDDPDPFYLRIGVADQITPSGFDHRTPEGAAIASEGVPGPSTTEQGVTYQRHQAEVEVLSWDMNRVPTYAELTAVDGLDGNWRYDQDQQVVFAGDTRSSGLRYSFEYARPEFDRDALRRADPLPDDHPIQAEFGEVIPEEAVTELVAELTAGIDNPYDQVLALHQYFSIDNGFRYSLETGSEVTGSAIVDFLIENKAGFCVQYSVGMAWMVRELGLPARVAVGFTRGNQREENTYLLTNHNLHAWTEVYFDGFGWVPFDPTPRGSIPGNADRDWAPDPNAPPDPTNPGGGADPGTSQPPASAAPEAGPEFAPEPGGGTGGVAGRDQSSWLGWTLGGLVVLLALLAAPALRRGQLRRHRIPRRGPAAATGPAGGAAPGLVGGEPAPGAVSGEPAAAARHRAHQAWDELLDTMIDFQVPLHPAETPRVTADRLVTECRLTVGDRAAAADGVRLLGRAEERARYAPSPLAPVGLGGAMRAVRRALASQATLRVRLRALLLPPSTLRRWRTAIGDAASRVAVAGSRLGDSFARLSPRRLLHTPR